MSSSRVRPKGQVWRQPQGALICSCNSVAGCHRMWWPLPPPPRHVGGERGRLGTCQEVPSTCAGRGLPAALLLLIDVLPLCTHGRRRASVWTPASPHAHLATSPAQILPSHTALPEASHPLAVPHRPGGQGPGGTQTSQGSVQTLSDQRTIHFLAR